MDKVKFADLTHEYLSDILDNIREHKSYYVAGTLCVDNILPDGDVLCVQMDETFNAFSSGEARIMTSDNTKKTFAIYKEVKGETEYYKKKFQKSSINI